MKSPSPHYGLLPAGFSAEHFGPNDYFYWDDFWGLAGLRDAAFASRVLGDAQTAVAFEREFDSFRADLMASLAHVEERLGEKVMPTSPYRRIDSGAIGCVVALYPLRLLKPDDPLIVNTVRSIREKCFFENGFFQDMIHAGINAYLTAHIAHCYLYMRRDDVWTLVDYVLKKASPTGYWPEAIHPATGGGCMGDGAHFWASADWLLLLRDLMLFEEGDALAITAVPSKAWATPGTMIEVHRAPTHFGEVSYGIEIKKREAVLSLDCKFFNPPSAIEWTLPFEAIKAKADGKSAKVEGRKVMLDAGSREVRVRKA